MKRFEEYGKWVMALVFAIIVIAVYKTFDNFSKITAVLKTVWDALTPLVIGFVIAYVFNIPCSKIEARLKKSKYSVLRKISKGVSIILVYLVAVFLLYVGIRLIVPDIYKNIKELYNNIPTYFDEAVSVIGNWQEEHDITLIQLDTVTATNAFSRILGNIDIAQFAKYAQGVIKITSGVMSFSIGIITSIYMLIEKERIVALGKRLCKLFLNEKSANKVTEMLIKINQIFAKYIFCLLLDAALMAVFATLVLSLLKVKYAIILGLIIGLSNLIPYFGAIIAGVVTVVITLLTGGPMQAIWAGVALFTLQQIDGNFVGPKIMGEMLDISPLWIIFAVTLGGGLLGAGGMIISVPIFMALRLIASELIELLETRKAAKEASKPQ